MLETLCWSAVSQQHTESVASPFIAVTFLGGPEAAGEVQQKGKQALMAGRVFHGNKPLWLVQGYPNFSTEYSASWELLPSGKNVKVWGRVQNWYNWPRKIGAGIKTVFSTKWMWHRFIVLHSHCCCFPVDVGNHDSFTVMSEFILSNGTSIVAPFGVK